MNKEPDCYGKMFPSVLEIDHNRSVSGRVFGCQADYPGQVATKAVTVNDESWHHCLSCPQFDACYRLSAGTAIMEIALRALPNTLY